MEFPRARTLFGGLVLAPRTLFGHISSMGRVRPSMEQVARGWIDGVALALLLASCASPSPPAAHVGSAVEVGILPRSETVRGRDGGSSALAFGRSIWTYGDTVLAAPDEHGESWHTNSFGIARTLSWSDGFDAPVDTAGAPRYFIERTDEELAWDQAHAGQDCPVAPCGVRWALWPSQPLFDEAHATAWVLYGLYNDAQPSGIGIARWSGLEHPVERARLGDSWLLFPHGEPEYANAATVFEGHLYAFGCTLDFVKRHCSLARVAFDAAADRSAWTFFDGHDWVSDYRLARTLFDGGSIMNVGWSESFASWHLVYSPPLDQGVYLRTAPALTGPWSDATLLFRVDGDPPYDAQHHPEMAERGGAVQYVTYSRPNGGGLFASEHAAWRVELTANGAP